VLDPASEPTSVPLIVSGGAAEETPRPLTPEAPTTRRIFPLERLGAFIEILMCSGLPTQILNFSVLTGLGIQHRADDGSLSTLFVVAMSLIDMVLVIGLVCLFLRAHDESVREFVCGARRPLREAALGAALIPAAFMLVVLVLAVILSVNAGLNNVPVNPFEHMMQTPRDAAIFAFVVMFAGGVREEVQRGFIIRRFSQYLGGGPVGILIYSAIFGLGHVEQGYAAAIATGLLGAAWGFLYWWRGSIIAPVISHAGFNLAQLLKYLTLASR
jgi:membrane protease YdiL (CAAX protease family)